MRRNVLLVLIVLAIAGLMTVWAFAAETAKAPKLTAVTVAVKGLECSACATKLQKALTGVDGVSDVTATFTPPQVTAKLDEAKISAAAFARTTAQKMAKIVGPKTGASLVVYIDAEMCKTQKTMCKGCFTEIPKVLKSVKGVDTVTLDSTGKIATVTFAKGANVTTEMLTSALAKSSYGFIVSYAAPDATAAKTESSASACPMGQGGCPMDQGGCCGN